MIDPIKPESIGFSADRLERLSQMLQGYVDRRELPGFAVAVSRRDQLAYKQTFGWQDVESLEPIQLDTIFRIASMTKPVTAVAAMMLYEEGHFNLNSSVAEFIPGFADVQVLKGFNDDGPYFVPLERELTFRHLFTHTSGLSYGWNPDDPIDHLYQESRRQLEQDGTPHTMENFVNNLATMPLAFQPGTHWRYSLSTDVIGRLVEIISGQPLDVFFQQRIFDPLGMQDTGFYVPLEKEDRLAVLYGHQEGEDGLQRMQDQTSRERPLYLSGGGGLVSTLGDYLRFARMLTNRGALDGVRLLSPSTVGLFSINHAPEEALPFGFVENDLYHAGYGYSLATRVLMDVSKTGQVGSVGEFDWGGAFGTYFWVDPSQALCGVLMTQHDPNEFYPIKPQFKQLTYQALVD